MRTVSVSGEPEENPGVNIDEGIDFRSGEASRVSRRIAAAKPVIWRGEGEPLQLPWRPQRRGLIVLVDLRSGIATIVLAFLALGFRCIVVSAECDLMSAACARSSFPDAVQVCNVDELKAVMFRNLLDKRNVDAFVVGGGCIG